jgi:hypothetical protein
MAHGSKLIFRKKYVFLSAGVTWQADAAINTYDRPA